VLALYNAGSVDSFTVLVAPDVMAPPLFFGSRGFNEFIKTDDAQDARERSMELVA
jgi:hypothetical protein